MANLEFDPKDLNKRLQREFTSTAQAMNSYYDKALMRNALFTSIRNFLLKDVATVKETREAITYFNTLCKDNFKFVMFSARHKIHAWINEFEEARKEDEK